MLVEDVSIGNRNSSELEIFDPAVKTFQYFRLCCAMFSIRKYCQYLYRNIFKQWAFFSTAHKNLFGVYSYIPLINNHSELICSYVLFHVLLFLSNSIGFQCTETKKIMKANILNTYRNNWVMQTNKNLHFSLSNLLLVHQYCNLITEHLNCMSPHTCHLTPILSNSVHFLFFFFVCFSRRLPDGQNVSFF